MGLFKQKKIKDDVLCEDLILPHGETSGLLRIHIAFKDDSCRKILLAPNLMDKIYSIIHEEMQTEVCYVGCNFDVVQPPIQNGGAIYAAYRRDDEHDKKFLCKLQEYFNRNTKNNEKYT